MRPCIPYSVQFRFGNSTIQNLILTHLVTVVHEYFLTKMQSYHNQTAI
jgi:hypothetical protein